MKCQQCNSPSFYLVGEQEVPLCLRCYSILKHTESIEFLQNAIMMNRALDDMDMVSGIGKTTDRIPTEHFARAIQGSPTLTNITVQNSQIGVLNTGAIQKIDAAITLSKGSDVEPVTEQIKRLTELVIASNDLAETDKNEVIELTEAVAEEIVTKRRRSSLLALTKTLKEKVDGYGTLAAAAEKLWHSISSLLG